MTLLLSPCTPTSGSPPGIPSPQGYHWNLGHSLHPYLIFSLPSTFHHSTSSSQPQSYSLRPNSLLASSIPTSIDSQPDNPIPQQTFCRCPLPSDRHLAAGQAGSGHGRTGRSPHQAPRVIGGVAMGCGLRLGYRVRDPEGKPRIL